LRKLLVASVATALLAISAPVAAHAGGRTFAGGCYFISLEDPTPGGQLGGQNVRNGVVVFTVVPTTGGVPNGSAFTASCELRVNGMIQGTVLGPTSGTGFVADATTIQFTARPTDVVSMCTHVSSVNGDETVCSDPGTTDPIPKPVIDAIDAVFDTIELVIDLLDELVFSQLDPTLCAVLVTLAPTVNGLGHPELIHIEPASGDLFIGGIVFTPPPGGDLFWDCPPYVSG
jgi:hypothetical protein